MNYKGAPTQEILSAIIYGDKTTINNIIKFLELRLDVHSKVCRTAVAEIDVRKSQGVGMELEFLLDILNNANVLKAQYETDTNANKIIEEYHGLS